MNDAPHDTSEDLVEIRDLIRLFRDMHLPMAALCSVIGRDQRLAKIAKASEALDRIEAHLSHSSNHASEPSTMSDPISYHITGNHPSRLADPEDRNEPSQIVNIPLGAEPLQIAVYGHGLNADDAISAAFDYLKAAAPEWCNAEDWERHEESAYVSNHAARKGR